MPAGGFSLSPVLGAVHPAGGERGGAALKAGREENKKLKKDFTYATGYVILITVIIIIIDFGGQP
jgi:hypothetical protein